MFLASDVADYRHLRAMVRGRKLSASRRIWRRTPKKLVVQQSDGMRWAYVEPSKDALRGQTLGCLVAACVAITLFFFR